MIFKQLFDQKSSTYTYLIASSKGREALIIDPVLENVSNYIILLKELDLRLVKVIDTHIHADHVTGASKLKDITKCSTIMGDHTPADAVEIKVKDDEYINLENLKIKESELKSIEDDIKKKKNIISKDEFENEVIRLRQNIKKFKNYKNKLVSEIENKKNNDIKEFFTKVNPIIQNYMDNNSIDILLERKNVFMSKNSSDITEKLIIEINKKFK